MGQCIYVADYISKPSQGPVTREMRSEEWMNPAEAGRILAQDHFLNQTLGIWLYESDVYNKKALRKRLLALVDHVCSPDFLAEYETFGRAQRTPEANRLLAWRRDQARRLARGEIATIQAYPPGWKRPKGRRVTAAELVRDEREHEELCGPMCLGYPTNPKPAMKFAKAFLKKLRKRANAKKSK